MRFVVPLMLVLCAGCSRPPAERQVSIQPHGESEPENRAFIVGDKVEVEWRGTWYAATVIKTEAKRYRIHYADHDDSWDEWVGAARIRRPCPPCPHSPDQKAASGCTCPSNTTAVPLPNDTKAVAEDHGIGHHGGSRRTQWLLSKMSLQALRDFYTKARGSQASDSGSFWFATTNSEVSFAPLKQIPKRSRAPYEPVTDTPPPGYRSWIIIRTVRAPPPCPPCPKGQVRHSSATCRCGPPFK